MALSEATIYLEERCWPYVGGGAEEFVVPHSPPRVIDTEGATGRGEEGIKASKFLDWARDYREWWATQTCGPLGGPIELPISVVCFILVFEKHLFIYFISF